MNDLMPIKDISMMPTDASIVLFLIILLIMTIIFRKKNAATWQTQAKKELAILSRQLAKHNSKYILSKLSKIVRLIAIEKYGREKCASLSGKKWLLFLSKKDPKYNWYANGNLLITYNYAKNYGKDFRKDLKSLIKATKNLI